MLSYFERIVAGVRVGRDRGRHDERKRLRSLAVGIEDLRTLLTKSIIKN